MDHGPGDIDPGFVVAHEACALAGLADQCPAALVRAAGLEPAQASRPYGFSYHFGFHRRPVWNVCGLDYPFTVASPP